MLEGILIGVAIAVANQWLQMIFRRHLDRRERLLNRYADFIAVASNERLRAESFRAGLALWADGRDPAPMHALDMQRLDYSRELARVALQIRALEPDRELRDMVTWLASSQPFEAYLFPPRWHEGNYNERSERFDGQIAEYGRRLEALTDRVLRAHGSTFPSHEIPTD